MWQIYIRYFGLERYSDIFGENGELWKEGRLVVFRFVAVGDLKC